MYSRRPSTSSTSSTVPVTVLYRRQPRYSIRSAISRDFQLLIMRQTSPPTSMPKYCSGTTLSPASERAPEFQLLIKLPAPGRGCTFHFVSWCNHPLVQIQGTTRFPVVVRVWLLFNRVSKVDPVPQSWAIRDHRLLIYICMYSKQLGVRSLLSMI